MQCSLMLPFYIPFDIVSYADVLFRRQLFKYFIGLFKPNYACDSNCTQPIPSLTFEDLTLTNKYL